MYTKPSILRGFVLFVIFCASTQTVIATESYAVTDLGTLGGNESRAYGINEIGQVVGESKTADGHSHAFLWTPSTPSGEPATMIDLGTLGGTESVAFGINNLGIVVGRADTAEPGVSRAFLWDPNTDDIEDLGMPTGPSVARSINDAGEVVGTALDAIGFPQAFHRTQEGFIVFFSDFEPGDATSDGVALGYAGNTNMAGTFFPPAQAFKFGGETGLLALEDLGSTSFVYGMNTLNQAVGSVGSNGSEQASLWVFSALTDLGTLGGSESRARAINDLTQIVGSANTSTEIEHAFLWQEDVMIDLNDLLPTNTGWQLNEARDINESRVIVGTGTIKGQTHAFLLSAAGPAIPTTSEWGLVALTLALLTVGTIVLNRRNRKARCLSRVRFIPTSVSDS